MGFDFDRIIERRGTDSLKFDSGEKRGKPADILPLWVADMDFSAPEPVLLALQERVRHGIFGYTEPSAPYFDALVTWFTGRFGYTFDPEWVVITPGVVNAISIALRAFTAPGDAVLIQEPVYYPFRQTIHANGRRLAVNTLRFVGGKYTIDFADFERQIVEHGVKLFILCSPHNPVGRVWREDELQEMVRICAKHDVLILSDEIHCDFVFPGHTHHLLPTLVSEEAGRMILATAPSKTFNLPGLQVSNIFISDPDLRKAFLRGLHAGGLSHANTLGLVACQAAYSEGASWLEALLVYLRGNMERIDAFLRAELSLVRLVPPEGTYLAWLDCRQLGLSPEALDDKLLHGAGVWLNRGDLFGATGAGFVRLNAGCPRGALDEALARIGGVL
ncbi:MAG: pyridoxal phosphate-dependent aminotransferase [Oscillospiraceae bacterium]|nr:pyridoxal phosphate-dependent aminotransferase [Oscillospiraceae bacterium]